MLIVQARELKNIKLLFQRAKVWDFFNEDKKNLT